MNYGLSVRNNDKRPSQIITPKSYMAFEEIKIVSLLLMYGLSNVCSPKREAFIPSLQRAHFHAIYQKITSCQNKEIVFMYNLQKY